MAILRSSASSKKTFTAPRAKMGRTTGGFSLIEIVVVMAIMITLSSILVGYTRRSGRVLTLTTAEANVISLINRAKFLSIETFFEEAGSFSPSEEANICGYGVHVDEDTNEVFIFQDLGSTCPASKRYESGERLGGEVNQMVLDPNVLRILGGSNALTDIVYIPPDPEVVINGSPGFSGSAELAVELVGGSDGFTIEVDEFGRVQVQRN